MVFYKSSIIGEDCALLSKLSGENAVAGTRRVVKAIENDRATLVYVAQDCDLFIKNKLRALCDSHGVRLMEADSKLALGRACGIEVGTACAALLKD